MREDFKPSPIFTTDQQKRIEMFPTNIFDFDFSRENSGVDSAVAAFEKFWSDRHHSDERPCEAFDPDGSRRSALRRMAARALGQNRMNCYFRLLVALESYGDFEPVTLMF